MLRLTSILLLLSAVHFCLCQQETVTVKIEQGEIRGKVSSTINGLKYYSFVGVPYAKPPVGPLRFKGPQEPEPWDGIRDALEEGSMCPQIMGEYMGDEDCLFINVATSVLPDNGSDELKPVMVMVHGGGFTGGSGTLSRATPDYFLEEDVIFVSMNYRLAALGFLSTGDSAIPGNNGLKDQVFALKWVQKNIAQFGGNPENVTIFGISAGGCSIHHLVLSPAAAGLFHKAIVQSGSALDQWGYEQPEIALTKTKKLCELLGNSSTNTNEIAEFLRLVDAKDIVDATNELTRYEENRIDVYFELTSEQDVEAGEMVFLKDAPINIIRSGNFNQVPLISGTVSHEGSLLSLDTLTNASIFDLYNEHPELSVPKNLKIYLSPEEIQALGNEIKKFYYGDDLISRKKLMQFTKWASDYLIIYGVDRHVGLHAAVSKSPVYQYQLSFNGRWGLSKFSIGDLYPAVSHGDDSLYLFYNPLQNINEASPEKIVQKRMITMWTNFAKTGNPTPTELPLLQNITWSPVTPLDRFYLDIGNDLIIKRNLENDRMSFWEDLYTTIST